MRLCSQKIHCASALLSLLLASVSPLLAGEPQTPPQTPSAIQARIKALQEDPQLEETVRDQRIGLLKRAEQLLEETKGLTAKTKMQLEAIKNATGRRQTLEAQLANPIQEATIAAKDLSVADMEQRLAQAQTSLSAARQKVESIQQRLQQRTLRHQELAKLIAETTSALNKLPALPDLADKTAYTEEQMLQRATRTHLQTVVAAAQTEMRLLDAEKEILPLERDWAVRTQRTHETRAQKWQLVLAARRKEESDSARAHAARAVAETAKSHPGLRALAEANQALLQQSEGVQGLAKEIDRTTQTLEETRKLREQVESDQNRLRQEVDAVGLSRAVGLLLLRKAAELPQVERIERRRLLRQDDIAELQLQLLRMEEERADLAIVEDEVRRRYANLRPVPSLADGTAIRLQLRTLLQSRRDLLDQLIRDSNTHFSQLVNLDTEDALLARAASNFGTYVQRNALWMRNATPLNRIDWRGAVAAASWLLQPANWQRMLSRLAKDAANSLLEYLLCITGLLALIALRYRYARLSTFHEEQRLAGHGALRISLYQLAASLALVLPGPLLLLLLAFRLGRLRTGAEFEHSLSSGLSIAGWLGLLLSYLRCLCRPDGFLRSQGLLLADHAQTLHRQFRWLMVALLPNVFICGVFDNHPNLIWRESLGHLAFIGACLASALFFFVLFRSGGPLARRPVLNNSKRWGDQFEPLLYGFVAGLPLLCAVLSALGYEYGARQIAEAGLVSLLLLLGGYLLHAMGLRWVLGLRRQAAVHETEMGEGEDEEVAREMDREELFTGSRQAFRFLRLALILGTIVVLWYVWVDLLPALGILDRITLWSTITSGESGAMTTVISLADLCKGIAIVVITALAASNIPGLMEILILRRLPFDRGLRFALTTLSRYALVCVGIILAFTMVGVGWGQVQWLIAAMTVGLGFGLQEIFANFVSGLILLIERPVRVGDTVTVGEVSGTVMEIRIRATTILQWDRKELIVPNREFITSRLINWTLSDNIVRLDFPVGIAYGSDTKKAEALLYEVAQQHAACLKEPSPIVIFKSFGNSALQFELRVFIETEELRDYLRVWHEVNIAIDTAFRKARVEIAFPQRDLHIRSVRAPVPIAKSEQTISPLPALVQEVEEDQTTDADT